MPEVTVEAPDAPGATHAAAERATVEGDWVTLEGDVGIRRGKRALGARRIVHDRARQSARAGGDLVLVAPDYAIRAERGTFALDSGAFAVERARYRLPSRPMQGRASRITRDAAQVSELESATWSTCPRQREDWHISASQVTLDPHTRQGTARNAALWFKGWPLLYSPWFRFPLGSDRLTGFLAPRIGRSSSSGATVATPLYLNLHPQFDATLTPRWLERRGAQLDRSYTRVRQRGALGAWRTRIDAENASDSDYFDDLGDDLGASSQTHLLRRGDVTWRGAGTRLRARVEAYQTLDTTLTPGQRPYERLPQLTLDHDRSVGPLETQLESELVRFQRDDSITGERLRLVPEARWPLEAPGWFLRPRVAFDYTRYALERPAGDTRTEAIERSVPITSLDSGLVFDRFGEDLQQTLEPRLFYTYIPQRDQSNIPVFDSGSGRELLRASVGAIRFFDERRVTLTGGAPRDADTSDVLAEISVEPTPQWRLGTSAQWDGEAHELAERSVDIAFRGDAGGVFNLSHRYQRDRRRQVDASAAWPVSAQWSLLAATNWSLRDDRNLESVVGFQYDSCCWRLRAVARRFLQRDDDAADGTRQGNNLLFELTLKGLGPVGGGAGDLLERAIVGFDTADR
ncbi:MAG: hypothetical protein BRD57_05200 [Proteobacteria bacterium SW_6_67_9]|nr:MAG: hypothetical protein BRD57_05200 [Proteobacteria bacterium SW_6_67_9]